MARGRTKKSLEDKIKEIDEHFLDEVISMEPDQLKTKLAKMVGHEEEILEAKKNDESLKELEDQVKTAKATYAEPLSAIKLKKTLVVRMLRDQGKL